MAATSFLPTVRYQGGARTFVKGRTKPKYYPGGVKNSSRVGCSDRNVSGGERLHLTGARSGRTPQVAEGYYTLEHDTDHPEELLFPLGKAFLLCANPWNAHKVI